MRRHASTACPPARLLAGNRAAILTVLLLLITAPRAAAEAPGAAAGDPAPQAAQVQSLGDGEETIYLVHHDDTWSMHAEGVMASTIFELWQEAGGPELVSKMVLDFPYTLSMHRVTTERIVERLLEGYGYTLHYDAAGRLERVRVYSPQPTRMFKTPRLVESLGSWRQLETSPTATTAPEGAAQAPAANEPLQSSE